MKKNFRFAFPFFGFVLLLLGGITGCKKDKLTAGGEPCRVSVSYSDYGNTTDYWSYYYDEQGRVTRLFDRNYYSTITYLGDSAVYTSHKWDGTLFDSLKMKVDANGRILSFIDGQYFYDTEGHLLKINYGPVSGRVDTFTWQDGNLMKMDITVNGAVRYTYSYTYHADLNVTGWNYMTVGLDCFFGKAGRNLCKRETYHEISSGTTVDYERTYQLDGDGLVKSMTILFVKDNIYRTYSFSYECTDD